MNSLVSQPKSNPAMFTPTYWSLPADDGGELDVSHDGGAVAVPVEVLVDAPVVVVVNVVVGVVLVSVEGRHCE
jgi:hypothetical protein